VLDGELVEGHPMLLDRGGRVCVDLWPLVQAVPPTDGAEPELFVFDGHGQDGALLVAAPSEFEHHDAITRDWVATHVIAEIKTKTRMREQIRVAAHEWQDRARPDGLLWRGDALADLERWLRHTTGAAVLDDLEASFVAASRLAGWRSRWIRRSLVVAAAMIAPAAIKYHAVLEARTAQQMIAQAEVGEGRQALLHDDSAEARLHLAQAHRSCSPVPCSRDSPSSRAFRAPLAGCGRQRSPPTASGSSRPMMCAPRYGTHGPAGCCSRYLTATPCITRCTALTARGS
jgi:hypothetical protein